MYVMTPFTSLLVLENEDDVQAVQGRPRPQGPLGACTPCPAKIPVVYEPEPGNPRPSKDGQAASGRDDAARLLRDPDACPPSLAGSTEQLGGGNLGKTFPSPRLRGECSGTHMPGSSFRPSRRQVCSHSSNSPTTTVAWKSSRPDGGFRPLRDLKAASRSRRDHTRALRAERAPTVGRQDQHCWQRVTARVNAGDSLSTRQCAEHPIEKAGFSSARISATSAASPSRSQTTVIQ